MGWLALSWCGPPALQMERYGEGGIGSADEITGVAWSPDGDLLVGTRQIPRFHLSRIDPQTGEVRDRFEVPCGGELAGRPGSRWVALRCNERGYAIDPLTKQVSPLTTRTMALFAADDLVSWEDDGFQHFDESLRPARRDVLPFGPSHAAASGGLVVGVQRVLDEAPRARVAWVGPWGEGTAELDRVVTAVATDGERVVVAHVAGLSWLDARAGGWVADTDVAEPRELWFVGDILWVQSRDGWRRFAAPDVELAAPRGCVDTGYTLSAGHAAAGDRIAVATWTRAVTVDAEGAGGPLWLEPIAATLSESGALAVASRCGLTTVDRRTGAAQRVPMRAVGVWASPDGEWVATQYGYAIEFARAGRGVEARGVPQDCSGGCLFHGGWSRDGRRFVLSAVGRWGDARSVAWEPARGAEPVTAPLAYEVVRTDQNIGDDIYVVAPDGSAVYQDFLGTLYRHDLERGTHTVVHRTDDVIADVAVDDAGRVVIVECALAPDTDALRSEVAGCQRRVLPDGPTAPLPPSLSARLSSDGSHVFVQVDDTHVHVHSATGALVAQATSPQPIGWPPHTPNVESARTKSALLLGTDDGTLLIVEAAPR